MRFALIALAAAITLAGCGTRTKTVMTPGTGAIPARATTGPVCLFAGGLPPEFKFVEIAKITSTKRSYGSTDEVTRAISAQATKLGADAVLNLQAGQRFKGPLPWRVTSPTGEGSAIRLLPDGPAFNCEALGGRRS